MQAYSQLEACSFVCCRRSCACYVAGVTVEFLQFSIPFFAGSGHCLAVMGLLSCPFIAACLYCLLVLEGETNCLMFIVNALLLLIID